MNIDKPPIHERLYEFCAMMGVYIFSMGVFLRAWVLVPVGICLCLFNMVVDLKISREKWNVSP